MKLIPSILLMGNKQRWRKSAQQKSLRWFLYFRLHQKQESRSNLEIWQLPASWTLVCDKTFDTYEENWNKLEAH